MPLSIPALSSARSNDLAVDPNPTGETLSNPTHTPSFVHNMTDTDLLQCLKPLQDLHLDHTDAASGRRFLIFSKVNILAEEMYWHLSVFEKVGERVKLWESKQKIDVSPRIARYQHLAKTSQILEGPGDILQAVLVFKDAWMRKAVLLSFGKEGEVSQVSRRLFRSW
jgi:hypothetical protein